VRGGTLLEIGADEPLEAEVMKPREARAIARELTSNREEAGGLELVGHVGAEGRAGSSGRVRALVGVGGRPSARSEIVASVTVGPQFSPPSLLEGGGPMVLGFEAGFRLYARDPATDIVALFIETGASVDLRFPGADPGIGLHAGAALRVWSQVAVEAAIGGSFVAFRAFDSEHRSTVGGATGGLRVALRFGGVRESR
jgi:hypothetical protein